MSANSLLVGFTMFIENMLVKSKEMTVLGETAKKLRSLLREAPEEVAYGNPIDFVLFHYSKSGRDCIDRILPSLSHSLSAMTIAQKVFEDIQECGSEKAAHAILLAIVLEYMKSVGYVGHEMDIASVLDSLSAIDDARAVLLKDELVSFLVRARRVAEALVES